MNTPLTIVAKIQARAGFEAEVEAALLAIIKPTLDEVGCLQYDMHRDHNTPGLFLFFENWSSRSLWEDHMKSDHLATMKTTTEGKIEETNIFEMELLKP